MIGTFITSRGRFSGFFASPNAVGLFVALVLPLAVWKYMQEKKKWVLVLGVLLVASLLMCRARSAMLSVLVSGGFFLINIFQGRKLFIITLLAFIFLAFALYVELFGWVFFSEFVRMDSLPDGSGRTEAWNETLRFIRQRPWLGYGFGTEDHIFAKFVVRFREHSGAYVHNSYLGLVSQLGIIGALLFFVPLLGFVAKHIVRVMQSGATRVFSLRLAVVSSIMSGLIYSFFESWIYTIGNAFSFLFWVLVMILYSIDKNETADIQNSGSSELVPLTQNPEIKK